jgi:hypothetical protein
MLLTRRPNALPHVKLANLFGYYWRKDGQTAGLAVLLPL